ncbi:HAD family hydrolase [Paraliomyxa miuraensis]|uniref:HAD family hydrolase n=1 Tax=Paraliomyxa miuraensis TaxID=376150 RepID=UPI002256ADDB|nr:HAD family hydrolase [Paraliomyxa miuraensis]MCX4239689.1 HAD family hydrolase [Paraliomyxa miuraensis]
MTRPAISLVFTDLDNTLYDWVAWYSRAFYRMLDGAAARADVPRGQLLTEMQQLYRSRQGLEQPEALLHAPSIQRCFGSATRARQALARVFASYYHAAHGNGLRTYPGVRSTLQRMAALGVMVVGHTEAPANHAAARLRALGLEHAFVALLAAPAAPDDPTILADDSTELPFPVRCLNTDERKPNPAVVLDLCERLRVSPRSALYVGDSLARDVRMARDGGLWTAWARYGTSHDPRDWQRVVDVSPWTAAQRAAACQPMAEAEVAPHVVLHESFSELLQHFELAPAHYEHERPADSADDGMMEATAPQVELAAQ